MVIHITQCIQVTVSLAEESPRMREVNGLLSAAKTYGMTDNIIITLDDDHIVLEEKDSMDPLHRRRGGMGADTIMAEK